MEGLIIRDMALDDLVQVHAIESRADPSPWSITSFSFELDNSEAVLKVAVMNARVIGYICLRSTLDIAQIMKISVVSGFRDQGIGSMLLRQATQEIRRTRPDIRELSLEVRESNIAAIRLYKKFGFREKGMRPAYYSRPQENALIMALNLPETGHD